MPRASISPTGLGFATLEDMVALVIALILALVLGLTVLVAVALPARREGRDLLTPHGEDVVARVRERTGTVAAVTRERTGDLLGSAKDRVETARDVARERITAGREGGDAAS